MVILDSQCLHCIHAQYSGNRFMGRCAAYPSKIPIELVNGEADHRQPYPGDNGIRFEALPGKRHPLDVIQNNEGDQK